MLPPRRLALYIDSSLHQRRVDSLLRHELALSGSAVRRAKRMPDGILLDQVPVFTNARVRCGQKLSVRVGDMPTTLPLTLTPMPGPLSIAYEDEDLLVVDKPAPLPMHPSPTHFEHTLANYVLHYYTQIGLIAAFHPVSRLDNGTSGLVLIAKHAHAHERLSSLLHTEDYIRRYLAVCEGVPPQPAGMICAPIGRAPGEVLRREVRPDGAYACTEYTLLRRTSSRSLLSLRLHTGRTHQIRVHLHSLGCPLVGDFLYGQECAALPRRFALHAAQLTLKQPINGEMIDLHAPLPMPLAALVENAT